MDELWLKNTVATAGLVFIALLAGYCYGRYKAGAEVEGVDYSSVSDSACVLDNDSESQIQHREA